MATQIKLGIVDSRTLKPEAGGGSEVQGQSALLFSKTVSKPQIQTRTPAKKLVKKCTGVIPSIFSNCAVNFFFYISQNIIVPPTPLCLATCVFFSTGALCDHILPISILKGWGTDERSHVLNGVQVDAFLWADEDQKA